jgi:hypothetical protein
MRRIATSSIVGVLLAAMIGGPVLAASAVCLQHNRMRGWQAIDERTLVFSDTNFRRYTVELSPGCLGITDGSAKLIFRTWTNLSCLMRGDLIEVTAPGRGLSICTAPPSTWLAKNLTKLDILRISLQTFHSNSSIYLSHLGNAQV